MWNASVKMWKKSGDAIVKAHDYRWFLGLLEHLQSEERRETIHRPDLRTDLKLPDSGPGLTRSSDSIPRRSSSECRTSSAKGSSILARDQEDKCFWARVSILITKCSLIKCYQRLGGKTYILWRMDFFIIEVWLLSVGHGLDYKNTMNKTINHVMRSSDPKPSKLPMKCFKVTIKSDFFSVYYKLIFCAHNNNNN